MACIVIYVKVSNRVGSPARPAAQPIFKKMGGLGHVLSLSGLPGPEIFFFFYPPKITKNIYHFIFFFYIFFLPPIIHLIIHSHPKLSINTPPIYLISFTTYHFLHSYSLYSLQNSLLLLNSSLPKSPKLSLKITTKSI